MADKNRALALEIAAAGKAAGLDITPELVAFTIGFVSGNDDTEDVLISNVQQMNRLKGYDIVIVCCSNQSQEDYWQSRLESVRGQVMPASSIILAVHEDWPGGAGNGLGTLYAYQKAVAKASAAGHDLNALLAAGSSVAMFHTAGKGTRLAPLPGSESNNKPAVKLPGLVEIDGVSQPITILEGVIKQTGIYAASRGGRLSVYWGDQIFVPSLGCEYTPHAHVDILARLGPWPTKQEWTDNGLDQFGLIAVSASGAAAQVEKVDYDTAEKLLADLGEMAGVGTSLGSFSVDHAILAALLAEFDAELAAKAGKLDTDPHFWMPMTLPRAGYVELMGQKGVETAKASAHWDRIAGMVSKFRADTGSTADLFGAVDVGANPYWWDYGQIKYYYTNNTKIVGDDMEAVAMRLFFGVGDDSLQDGSVVLGTKLGGGSARNSVLVNCNIGHVDVENSVLINVSAKSVTGKCCILCNVAHADDLAVADDGVMTDVAIPQQDRVVRMISHRGIDGGKAWSERVCDSPLSPSEVHAIHQETDVSAAAALMAARRRECAGCPASE